MEKYEKYREDLILECKEDALISMISEQESFINIVIDRLKESENIEDFNECFYQGIIKQKNTQIDGYYFDSVDKMFSAFIFDYHGEECLKNITKIEVEKLYKKVRSFIENSVNGFILDVIEESLPAHDLSAYLMEKIEEITKFKIFIITDKKTSNTVKKLKDMEIYGKDVDVVIWDIERIYELYISKTGKEIIEIDFKELNGVGIQCLEGAITKDYQSYLTMISGDLLAELYLEYGASLLEGNVRSFLSTRGKVNKAIRKTILTQPDMFFAYNNGIAATANDVIIEENNGIKTIISVENLQIINGGQTTASIANAIIKDNARDKVKDLKVPMKLSVVTDSKLAEDIIPKISRTANMQNKVNDADFFSNHPYHIRIEEYSRKVYAPEKHVYDYKNGMIIVADTRTKWYYERARGQYDQEQMQMTKTQRQKFKILNPKNQLLKKTDWSKYVNTFLCKPDIVSKGAQNSMRAFADTIDREWNKGVNGDAIYNESYFKKMISVAIMFKETELLVSNSNWYKDIKAYRANIVTYSLSYLFYYINKNLPKKSIDFKKIWNEQNLYKELREQIAIVAHEVLSFITREDRKTLNVTEWCKMQLCWTLMKDTSFQINNNFIDTLVDIEEMKSEEIAAKKDKTLENNINAEIEVVKLGKEYWRKVLTFGLNERLLTKIEETLLVMACNIEKKLPTSKQSKSILEIRERMREEGMKE